MNTINKGMEYYREGLEIGDYYHHKFVEKTAYCIETYIFGPPVHLMGKGFEVVGYGFKAVSNGFLKIGASMQGEPLAFVVIILGHCSNVVSSLIH